ncbi:MAG TPA: SanA protein [Firmicutes bacterium]|jgi:putative sanA protein|nr:SanA protein [Bacillota bacterium]
MLGVKMKKIFKYILIVLIVIILVPVIINFYVILSTKNRIVSGDSELLTDIDYIVILGAGIRRGKPSPMLEDRLKTGISLYNNDISNKILITGDHMNDDYDEVTVMKNYLLEHGIPEEDIITDNYGISTYDSIYRVKNVYKSNKVVIVSQRYHLYRALFLSDNLDLESYGVEADLRYYYGQWYREIREILARNKDFIKGIIKPKAVYTAFNYN